MKKILFDTNFLLIPFQFNVDVFSEIHRIIDEKYELFVLDKSVVELEKIVSDRSQKVRDRNAAKLGLQLLKAKNVKILKTSSGKDVDSILAGIKGYTIATQDLVLKRRIKGKKIVLRQRKHLVLI